MKKFSKEQIRREALARIQEAAMDLVGDGNERVYYIQGVLDLMNSFPDEEEAEENA